MAWNINLFVRDDVSLSDLASTIELASGFGFYPVSDDDESWYEYKDETVLITVGGHDLSNDRNLYFEEYSWHIAFWPTIDSDPERGKAACLDAARRVFEGLMGTGKFDLLLVENLQKKLGSHNRDRTPQY